MPFLKTRDLQNVSLIRGLVARPHGGRVSPQSPPVLETGTRAPRPYWRGMLALHALALAAPPRPTTTTSIVEQPVGQGDACDDVRCSGHSYCYEGVCRCAPGFQPPDCVVDVCFGHINGSDRGCHGERRVRRLPAWILPQRDPTGRVLRGGGAGPGSPPRGRSGRHAL